MLVILESRCLSVLARTLTFSTFVNCIRCLIWHEGFILHDSMKVQSNRIAKCFTLDYVEWEECFEPRFTSTGTANDYFL